MNGDNAGRKEPPAITACDPLAVLRLIPVTSLKFTWADGPQTAEVKCQFSSPNLDGLRPQSGPAVNQMRARRQLLAVLNPNPYATLLFLVPNPYAYSHFYKCRSTPSSWHDQSFALYGCWVDLINPGRNFFANCCD